MSFRTKAVISLAILPSLMMELMTANLPGFTFFNPVLLIILFLGYSLPVLLIREFAVRYKLNAAGIFIMGLAYGIFNEGIGAKTLLLVQNIPTPAFDDYGYFLGISFPWAAYVLTIHAVVSVLFPIAIVHYLYPAVSAVPWFGKRTSFTFLILSVTTGIAVYLSPYPFAVRTAFLPMFAVMIALLVFIASRMHRSDVMPTVWKGINPIFWGFVLGVIFMLGFDIIIAGYKVNLIAYFVIWILSLVLVSLYLKKRKWLSNPSLVLFGMGVYSVLAITGAISSVLKGHPEGALMGFIFLMIFIISAIRIKRRFQPSF